MPVSSGPAHCKTCARTWPESVWTLHEGEVFYWCPVCSQQIDMFPEMAEQTPKGLTPVSDGVILDMHGSVSALEAEARDGFTRN